jgi:outer membrane protein assembly factor BamB
VIDELQSLRGNCTRATGAPDAVFARGDLHGGTLRLQTDDNSPSRLPAMRPACQDGVTVANGQLFWGPWMCDCNHSLVGVISLGPAGDFDYEQAGTNADRLTQAANLKVAAFPQTDAKDWGTYRASNTRTAAAPVNVAAAAKLVWRTQPSGKFQPTAPVAAGGLVFTAGSDGVVRAHDAATGQTQWKAYTGGSIRYSPTVAGGRVYVGSYDGYAYAFEAATGRELWKFRAAPVERAIPLYGKLASTWPVATGVLVEDNVAYFAAGIATHDGTHVYAVNASTGELVWQNNSSHNLMDDSDNAVAGVAVQGHLLLHQGKLHMAGGNVVSPATFDAKSGECLNTVKNEWQKGPRGSELFLVDDKISVADRMLYSPRAYIPSRYYAKFLLQATTANTVMRGTENAIACYDNPIPWTVAPTDPNPVRVMPQNRPQAKARWQSSYFKRTDAVVMADNAVVIAGAVPDKTDDTKVTPALIAFNPSNGDTLWASQLPSAVAPWGLCLDRDGRVIATLDDGRTLCLAGELKSE